MLISSTGCRWSILRFWCLLFLSYRIGLLEACGPVHAHLRSSCYFLVSIYISTWTLFILLWLWPWLLFFVDVKLFLIFTILAHCSYNWFVFMSVTVPQLSNHIVFILLKRVFVEFFMPIPRLQCEVFLALPHQVLFIYILIVSFVSFYHFGHCCFQHPLILSF